MTSKTKTSPDDNSGVRQRRRSPRQMTDIGRYLEMLRLGRQQTLTEFANSAGLSHAVLSAIAYGQKNLTPHVVEKFRTELGMSEREIERLQHLDARHRAGKRQAVAEPPEESLPPTILVPAERLFRREGREDVVEARVVDPAPQEEFNSFLRGNVVNNLQRGCRYTYFTPHRPKAETIELSLQQGLAEGKRKLSSDVQLDFVAVPASLHPHFFSPARVLYQLCNGQIIGFWAFREPRNPSPFAQLVMPMDLDTAENLWAEYGRIISRLRNSGNARSSLGDDSLELELLAPNRKAKGTMTARRC